MWYEITYPFPNFNGATVAGIDVNACQYKGLQVSSPQQKTTKREPCTDFVGYLHAAIPYYNDNENDNDNVKFLLPSNTSSSYST